MSWNTVLLGRLAALLLGLGIGVWVGFGIVPYNSKPRRRYRSYVVSIGAELRMMHSTTTAEQFVMGQAGILAVSALMFLTGHYFVGGSVLVCVPLTNVLLARQKLLRITRIEEQLDGWVTALANALKATPAIAEAIASTVRIVDDPIRQELDVVVKEYHLGTPLDKALENMAERVGSRTVRTVVTTLIVARTSGGNLPQTLELAAASLREMARLEGVVRTKTAEGKAQAYVISAIPLPIYLGLRSMQPEMYRVMETTNLGNFLFFIAGVLWVAAALMARKILAVDI
jgi:tight adherence protein B